LQRTHRRGRSGSWPVVLVLLVLPVLVIPGVVGSGRKGSPDAAAPERFNTKHAASRAKIYTFPLRPTMGARGARGGGELTPAPSPFGFPVTAEGYPVYDLDLRLEGLRPAAAAAPSASYVVWLTTPELDRTEKLGAVAGAGPFRFRVSTMNKFIVIVTLEASPEVSERRGTIVLRGISPSGLMQSFASHELFNNMPHDRE
jgi:hypothetical protein